MILLCLAVAGCADERGPAAPAERPPFTPRAERATAPEPAGRWPTARLTRRAQLRSTPGGRVLATLRTRTEFGSPRVLSVLRRRGGWLRVEATEGRGWVPERSTRAGATDWSVHVDRSARRLILRRDGRRIRTMRVAVGRPGTETPLGRFAVTDKLRPDRPDSPYGCCALALTGRQPKLLPGWPGGDRLAIHATPQEESVGTAASLGCLRLRTRDARRLMRTLPLGTPVFVRA